jgi:hypothetical protein
LLFSLKNLKVWPGDRRCYAHEFVYKTGLAVRLKGSEKRENALQPRTHFSGSFDFAGNSARQILPTKYARALPHGGSP